MKERTVPWMTKLRRHGRPRAMLAIAWNDESGCVHTLEQHNAHLEGVGPLLSVV